MKRNKILSYILAVALMGGTMTSCSSDFLKEYSQDLGRVQTPEDLNELLMGDCVLPLGFYSNVKSICTYKNENYVVLHFMSDELQENLCSDTHNSDNMVVRQKMFPYFTWQQNTYLNDQGKNTYASAEENLWNLAYEKINNCNMVIAEGNSLKTNSVEDVAKVRRVQGECYFLRAFYYLTLANLYGKPYTEASASSDLAVPIKTSESVEDKEYQRATVADVYQQVLEDLKHAEELLLNVNEQLSIYHASIEAVYILRSRVALYMQDWQTAEEYAQKALDKNSNLQNLVGADGSSYPMSLSNPEVIYSNGASCLGNILQQSPREANLWYNFAPIWTVSDDLYQLYDDGDARKVTYVTTEDDVVDHHPTYHKIDNSVESAGKYKEVSDVFSIRTAEAYLNMAEAKAQLGEDAEACSWLSKLRQKRMSQGAEVSLTGAELIQYVRDERARELCFEGHRWFDLRRYMVDVKYPYAKEIVHSMSSFQNYYRDKTDYYKLEKNDAAYVLDIPKNVKDFQPSIGSNPRPQRLLQRSDDASGSDDGDDEDW